MDRILSLSLGLFSIVTYFKYLHLKERVGILEEQERRRRNCNYTMEDEIIRNLTDPHEKELIASYDKRRQEVKEWTRSFLGL